MSEKRFGLVDQIVQPIQYVNPSLLEVRLHQYLCVEVLVLHEDVRLTKLSFKVRIRTETLTGDWLIFMLREVEQRT